MNRYLLFFCLTIFLFSKEIMLQKKYEITGDDFNISAIFPEIKNDYLLISLKNKNRFRIASKKLQKMLKKHYVDAVITFPFVEIIKKSKFKKSKIMQKIINEYKSHYDNIKIQDIFIKPNGYFNQLDMKLSQISFAKNNLLKNKGSFWAIFKNKKRKKKVFFKYYLKATINVLKSIKNIKQNSIINSFNTQSIWVSFEHFSSFVSSTKDLNKIMAKSYIKKGKIILKNMVKKIPDIRKNQKVRAIFRDGAIAITIFAKAMQDGQRGEMIKIKTDDGKVFKALILEKNKLVIE